MHPLYSFNEYANRIELLESLTNMLFEMQYDYNESSLDNMNNFIRVNSNRHIFVTYRDPYYSNKKEIQYQLKSPTNNQSFVNLINLNSAIRNEKGKKVKDPNYDTPNGLYAYPLEYVRRESKSSIDGSDNRLTTKDHYKKMKKKREVKENDSLISFFENNVEDDNINAITYVTTFLKYTKEFYGISSNEIFESILKACIRLMIVSTFGVEIEELASFNQNELPDFIDDVDELKNSILNQLRELHSKKGIKGFKNIVEKLEQVDVSENALDNYDQFVNSNFYEELRNISKQAAKHEYESEVEKELSQVPFASDRQEIMLFSIDRGMEMNGIISNYTEGAHRMTPKNVVEDHIYDIINTCIRRKLISKDFYPDNIKSIVELEERLYKIALDIGLEHTSSDIHSCTGNKKHTKEFYFALLGIFYMINSNKVSNPKEEFSNAFFYAFRKYSKLFNIKGFITSNDCGHIHDITRTMIVLFDTSIIRDSITIPRFKSSNKIYNKENLTANRDNIYSYMSKSVESYLYNNINAIRDFDKDKGRVVINGKLNTGNLKMKHLISNMHIKGNLDITDNNLKTLPPKMKVDGNITIYTTTLEKIPNDLSVGGVIYAILKNRTTKLKYPKRLADKIKQIG